jgi:hypothetical protein
LAHKPKKQSVVLANSKPLGRGKPGVKNPKKKSKYKNMAQRVDGLYFHSTAEAERYKQLKPLADAELITDFELQPRFPIKINGVVVFTYVADFSYRVAATGETRIEDVKGQKTDVYKIKKKCFDAYYGHDLIEIPAAQVVKKWAGCIPHKERYNDKVWTPLPLE